MTFKYVIDKLRMEAKKSKLVHKHACVAIKKGKIVSPTFHNYMRAYICDFKCGSAHAEMATINYLLGCNNIRRDIMYIFYKYMHGMDIKQNDMRKIKRIRKKFNTIDLIIIRQSKTKHNLGYSKPCPECLKMMQIINIKNVIYTDHKGDFSIEKVIYMNSVNYTQMSRHIKDSTYVLHKK